MPNDPTAQALDPDTFHTLLIEELPRLRMRAFALTRNRASADDLVQDTVVNALAAQTSFAAGTNLGAWLTRIMRNRFISDLRRRRETTELDETGPDAPSLPSGQEEILTLRELDRLLGYLPAEQRLALVMVVLEGMSCEDVAGVMGCAVGTVKCRVFRARRRLEGWLTGTTPHPGRAGISPPDRVEAVASKRLNASRRPVREVARWSS